MATTIVTKYGGDAPAASDIVRGELAVDTENGRLYTENSSGAVVEIGLNPEGNVDVTGTVTTTGSVGIGTAAPNVVIHAVDASGTAVIALDDSRSNVGDTASVDFRHNGITGSLVKSSAVEDFSSSANRSSDLQFWTRNNGTQIQAATISSAGNVGIGTDSPAIGGGRTYALALTIDGGVSGGSEDTGALEIGGSTSVNDRLVGSISYFNRDNSGAGATTRQQVAIIEARSVTSDSNTGDDSGGDLTFGTKSEGGSIAERLRIKSDGDIQQGTYSDTTVKSLQLRTNKALLTFETDGATNTNGSSINYSWVNGGQGPLKFKNASSTVMTLDASGNLLVGTTTTAAGNEGMVYFNGSSLRVTRDSDEPLNLDRLTSDGTIVALKKDGSTVGSIGSISSDLYIAEGNSGLRFDGENNQILPASTTASTDGTCNLGASSARFKDLYLSSGVVFGTTGGSVTSKTLDDYEEGSWTPSFSDAGSPSYSTQYGRYTKIGRVVYCTIALRATSVSGSSTIEIAGLPFSPADTGDTTQRSTYSPFLGGHCSGLSESTGRFRVQTNTNMPGIKGSTSTSFMTAAEFSSGGSPQITGNFWYYTS
jgi:hypothetical protein